MENKAYILQIDAYLEGKLSPTDKQAFEAALSIEADLQEALRWHRLANTALIENAEEAQIRQIADGIRQRIGKLPTPQAELSFWLRLFNWLKSPLGILGSLAVAALLSVFVFAQTLPTESDLVLALAFTPANASIAGNPTAAPTPSNENQFLTELSSLYFNETPGTTLQRLAILRGQDADSLRRTLIDYYAAHAHLAVNEYAEADALFKSILAKQSLLQELTLTKDIGKVQFNQILTQLALTHKETAAVAALETLSKAAGTKGEVRKRCAELVQVLGHPLRWLR